MLIPVIIDVVSLSNEKFHELLTIFHWTYRQRLFHNNMISSIVGKTAMKPYRLNISNLRGLRSSSLRLNESKNVINKPKFEPPTQQQTSSKKGFSFGKFLFYSTSLTLVAYGGVLYAALKNDDVMDFVIDKQLPFYEEGLDLIEKGSIEDIKNGFEKLVNKAKSLNLPSTDELTQKGEHMFEETKKKLATSSGSSGKDEQTNPTNVTTKDATPAQQLQKPVETVQKTVEHLPLITLNKGVSSSVDDSVKSTIESFNDLIKSIDIGAQNSSTKESLIRAINENITKLASKLNSLTGSFDEELQAKLKVSQTELLSSYTKKELELTETLLDQFNREKAQLEQKLNLRLKNEIESTKATISQAAVNAVSMMRIEQTKNFEKIIKSKIDEERDGRLAHLDKLNQRLKEIEEFSISLETQLVNNHQKTQLQKSISNLKHVLSASSSRDVNAQPQLLKKYFNSIDQVASGIDDEVIKLAVADLKPLIINESTHSILTHTQLLSKWEQLTPELRLASLLPPNAGLLGHFASLVFSKLLLPVKGSKPSGKDIESVIGRIETSLSSGDLDIAIEEATNLKGWPRRLADDFVKEGRKRLEVQFLVDLLESEARIV